MSQITTHILDTARGSPAVGVEVSLHSIDDTGAWTHVGKGETDADGRVPDLCPTEQALAGGTYCVHFATASYFEAQGLAVFYPFVDVVFTIDGDGQHYHIPLLLSPYSYSTYRGS
jgi:5-hydroxyisourate hydrolase